MILGIQFDMHFFLHFVFNPPHALLVGVLITVVAAIIAESVGTMIGVLSALACISRRLPLRIIGKLYVWFFRGVPTLVQIFMFYFGLPALLGIDLFPTNMGFVGVYINGAIVAGVLALALNEGAYMSEIVRAGILSVDPGQREAALAVGMTSRTAMRRIVLPQAVRVIIPPLGNQFNNMLKITSLLSVIGIEELFRVTQDIEASSFRVFETFLGCAVYYLALVSIWSIIQRLIERRFDFARVKSNRSLVTRILGKSGRGSGARQAQNPTNFGEGAIQRQLKEFEPDPVTKTTPEFSPRGGSNV